MTRKSYFGPAGIFSTDNPVSDAMQIAAEQGPPDEEDWWHEELAEVDYLYGSCWCGWCGTGMYWSGDAADYVATVQELQGKHKTESPKCTCEPAIG